MADGKAWLDLLNSDRKMKDMAFKSDPGSPIPAERRAQFEGLSYFPPNEMLRFTSELIPDLKRPVVTIAVSNGPPGHMERVGHFELDVGGEKVQLWAYQAGHASLFVPFRDATSGKESYGAGRSLDLEEPEGGNYQVDFNRAYNPYCAYSECYSCPLPPRENWLNVAIHAGERAPTDH